MLHIVLASIALSGAPVADAKKAEAPTKVDSVVFAKLKSLVGTWTATVEGKPMSVEYSLVSGGRCIKEAMPMHEGTGTMDTIYCDNGQSVVATHYCGSGNQPRFKASQLGADKKSVQFEFLDATGLTSADEGHMHKVAMEFTDADHYVQKWSMYEKGAEKHQAVFTYARATAKK